MEVTQADGDGAAEPEAVRRERMIAAFARAASTIAWEGSLQVVLDRLAQEVLAPSGANACSIALWSPWGNSLDVLAAAGCPPGYLERTREAIALGAPVISLQAYRTRAQVVGTMKALTKDPRFAPYTEMIRTIGWKTAVAVPLMVRDDAVGALTALFTDEREPSESDISFLRAMADHGAIAINTARLLAEAHEKAAQDERNRLARDVHDAVSQSLFSMRLRIKALQMAAERSEDVSNLRPGLAGLESTVDRAVDDMRSLIMHLRPSDLQGNDLAKAVRRYAEAISDRDAVLVEVRVSEELPTLPRVTEEQIYLIAREAIGNSVDHAKATRLLVRLGVVWHDGAGFLFVEVADDGVGFDAGHERPGHLGLSNMRTRSEQIRARLRIESSSEGTTVRLEVPLAPTASANPS
jgi:signal transduction histidine kinase